MAAATVTSTTAAAAGPGAKRTMVARLLQQFEAAPSLEEAAGVSVSLRRETPPVTPPDSPERDAGSVAAGASGGAAEEEKEEEEGEKDAEAARCGAGLAAGRAAYHAMFYRAVEEALEEGALSEEEVPPPAEDSSSEEPAPHPTARGAVVVAARRDEGPRRCHYVAPALLSTGYRDARRRMAVWGDRPPPPSVRHGSPSGSSSSELSRSGCSRRAGARRRRCGPGEGSAGWSGFT
jgi:hypothetical protein